ncbi:MAG TPA: hypothetical protein PLP17_04480 [Oligoflexia bacterium]|nr:hypothetical protein [Oligoflexia bacterium]
MVYLSGLRVILAAFLVLGGVLPLRLPDRDYLPVFVLARSDTHSPDILQHTSPISSPWPYSSPQPQPRYYDYRQV